MPRSGNSLGALSLTGVVPALLTLGTLYERASPLLRTTPEDGGRPAGFGVLRGEVEFHNVTFRYDADGPLVLDGVSLRARPGEFIALVGPSGAGKSSVLRLLLGFDKPASGAIFFDHQDAASIDMRAVRRQMGVVLQNGHAATGSILDNILGGAPLTEGDAWAAAHLAGLDEDILQMPMRMHTFAGENRHPALRRAAPAAHDRAGGGAPPQCAPVRRGHQRPRQSQPADRH